MRRNIVIVGASGGIGRALASSYLDEDVALYLTCNRGKERLDAWTKDCAKENSRATIRIFQADLANASGVDALVEEIFDACAEEKTNRTPRIDSLVVAAGIDLMTRESKASTFDERLARAWQIDVASTATIARRIGAAMQKRRREAREQDYAPAIVLFGWDGTERGQEGDTAQIYAACKGAVVAFARSLAQSLAPETRVNVVSPGWIRTTWGAVASESSQARVVAESLSRRWGAPEEVARVVRFLLSDAASYLNGQNIALNGGFSYKRS